MYAVRIRWESGTTFDLTCPDWDAVVELIKESEGAEQITIWKVES